MLTFKAYLALNKNTNPLNVFSNMSPLALNAIEDEPVTENWISKAVVSGVITTADAKV